MRNATGNLDTEGVIIVPMELTDADTKAMLDEIRFGYGDKSQAERDTQATTADRRSALRARDWDVRLGRSS